MTQSTWPRFAYLESYAVLLCKSQTHYRLLFLAYVGAFLPTLGHGQVTSIALATEANWGCRVPRACQGMAPGPPRNIEGGSDQQDQPQPLATPIIVIRNRLGTLFLASRSIWVGPIASSAKPSP
jgi:hypothetical protein